MFDLNPPSRGKSGLASWRVRGVLVVIGSAIALTGCATRGGKIPYDSADFGPPDRAGQVVGAYNVPLGPLDVLKINVFRVPDLSGEFQIDTDGMVNLPLLGRISVREENAQQFSDQLEQLYGQRYLNHPNIMVRVSETNNDKVVIEGGVNSSGIYPLRGKTTLLGAIALAHGVSNDIGNPKRVAIFRKRDGKTVAAAFDLISIRHGDMADPVVYPGDTIVVDSSQLKQLYQQLLQTLPALAVFRSIIPTRSTAVKSN